MGFPGKNPPAMQKKHMGWEFDPWVKYACKEMKSFDPCAYSFEKM